MPMLLKNAKPPSIRPERARRKAVRSRASVAAFESARVRGEAVFALHKPNTDQHRWFFYTRRNALVSRLAPSPPALLAKKKGEIAVTLSHFDQVFGGRSGRTFSDS